MSRIIWLAFFLVLVGQTKAQIQIQLDSTLVETRIVADNLFIPWDIDMDQFGVAWFSERNGRISTLNVETGEVKHIYTVPDVFQSTDNSGLHALALHPNFPSVPYIFVHYASELFRAKLVRLTFSISTQSIVETKELLPIIPGNESHIGSRILFDENQHLLFCTGDAYDVFLPQDENSLAGKVLRIDIDGEPVNGNPFNNEVYSMGHRNPQGLTLSDKGMLYSAEHGTGTDDELNIIYSGRNYGWPDIEGYCDLPSEQSFCDSNDVVEPIWTWTPTDAPCAATFFNHESIPEWQNSILMAFLKDKRIGVMKLADDGLSVIREDKVLEQEYGRIREIFVAPNGKIYLTTSNNEANGAAVVKPDDDKIIELYNPNFDYEGNQGSILSPEFIYPNPAQNSVFYTLDQEQVSVKIEIFDLKGNRVYAQSGVVLYRNVQLEIARNELRNGVYLVKITGETSDFEQTIKVVWY